MMTIEAALESIEEARRRRMLEPLTPDLARELFPGLESDPHVLTECMKFAVVEALMAGEEPVVPPWLTAIWERLQCSD